MVFHLEGAVEYSISLSSDRQLLTVSFANNMISTIALSTDSGADSLVIAGGTTPSVRYLLQPNHRRVRIYIDNAETTQEGIFIGETEFVERMEVINRDDGSVLILLYIYTPVMPGVGIISTREGAVTLMLYGRVESVSYIPGLRAVRICRGNGLTMNINQIVRFNEYLRGRYTMVLPAGADVPGLGIVPVDDDYLYSFMLARDVNGNVQLIFNTKGVLVFTIEETPDAYYIFARLPREVYSMVVVLDPGHGGNDPGVVRNGVRESSLVLTVSNKVAYLLSRHSYIGVYMTRHTDTNPSIFWRAEFADSFADILVSIHVNGFTNTAVHGIETLYVVSGGETGDFTSRNLAQIIQRNKIAQTGAHNRGLFNRPGLVVIRQAYTIPAVLSEMGFATNAQEAARMLTPAFQWQVARGLYYGILEAHGIIGR
jgi:N-acetylmuramoyl-L-alanine amidase